MVGLFKNSFSYRKGLRENSRENASISFYSRKIKFDRFCSNFLHNGVSENFYENAQVSTYRSKTELEIFVLTRGDGRFFKI